MTDQATKDRQHFVSCVLSCCAEFSPLSGAALEVWPLCAELMHLLCQSKTGPLRRVHSLSWHAARSSKRSCGPSLSVWTRVHGHA